MIKSTGKRRNPKAVTGNVATFALRMPEGLKQAIEEAAEANGRSINSEICERLQVSLSLGDRIEYSQGTAEAALNLAVEVNGIEKRLDVIEACLKQRGFLKRKQPEQA